MLFIGIDLGTSAVKLLLVGEDGAVLRTVSREYPLFFPHPGWSEQNPADWWDACVSGIHELLRGFDASAVAGIGCGGQMHGLVALDRGDRVLRPAILWNDGRTSEQVDYLNDVVGRDVLSAHTANIAFAGFTAPKLLWMRKHEPELFAQIDKIMLPKDYIQYKLTGVHACDYSDASGMLLLDVQHKCWSAQMLDVCSLREGQMPRLYESFSVTGTLLPDAAALLGLPETVKVVAGDPMQLFSPCGTSSVTTIESVGTSGTLFIASDSFCVDPHNALHAFAHASGGYHLMGCMLSAASCNKWFCEDILHTTDYAAEQAAIAEENLGKNRVFFLPYLMGERSPVNDTDARGTFVGLSMDTTRADLTQSVLEGVAFALRDSLEVARALGLSIERSKLCGGGAKSPLWRRILANVLGVRLDVPQSEEGPGYGGAMLAMVGCGLFPDVRMAANALVHVRETIEPEPELCALYDAQYRKFKEIYPAVRDLYKTIK